MSCEEDFVTQHGNSSFSQTVAAEALSHNQQCSTICRVYGIYKKAYMQSLIMHYSQDFSILPGISHNKPLYPWAQSHTKEASPSMHVAPLKQGEEAHSSVRVAYYKQARHVHEEEKKYDAGH